MYDTLSEKERTIFLSGVFDGEGSFGSWSNGRDRGRSIYVKVETTDQDMVQRFADHFGGNVVFSKARKENWKPTYTWRLRGEAALAVLKGMIPYCCKRRREKFYGLVKPTGYGCEDGSSHLQKQTRIKEVNE